MEEVTINDWRWDHYPEPNQHSLVGEWHTHACPGCEVAFITDAAIERVFGKGYDPKHILTKRELDSLNAIYYNEEDDVWEVKDYEKLRKRVLKALTPETPREKLLDLYDCFYGGWEDDEDDDPHHKDVETLMQWVTTALKRTTSRHRIIACALIMGLQIS